MLLCQDVSVCGNVTADFIFTLFKFQPGFRTKEQALVKVYRKGKAAQKSFGRCKEIN